MSSRDNPVKNPQTCPGLKDFLRPTVAYVKCHICALCPNGCGTKLVKRKFVNAFEAVTAKKQRETVRFKFAPKSENKNYYYFTPF
jgi:formate hydrogenlyase subunit 6/NADH:ubiquinone oxidoreductase subunit I